jgi:hypothetical protein
MAKLIALAATAAVGIVLAFAANAGGRELSAATFPDPAGDAHGAPDLTSLTISSGTNGAVSFAFTVTGMVKGTAVRVWLDTDRNATTGDRGSDHEVELSVSAGGMQRYEIKRYAGSRWVAVPYNTSMGMSITGDTWTVRTDDATLGGTTGFAFWGIAAALDTAGNLVAVDRLPDSGELTYDVPPVVTTTTVTTTVTSPPAPAVVPWIGLPTITPAARAGTRVSVTFPLADKKTGVPLLRGTMICDPQVNGKVLPHQESLGNGFAQLRFTIPKGAKGKELKVNLTIRVGSRSAHTVVTYTVR